MRSGTGPAGFRVIGVFKLALAVALALAGFGVFRLLHRDLGEALEGLVDRMRLDPESRVIQATVGRLAGIDHAHLKAIAAGTFFYAGLEAIEGVGLLLRCRWASWLTIVATALLLVPEGFEIAYKATPNRIVVLLVNLGILIYLIVKVRGEAIAAPTDR